MVHLSSDPHNQHKKLGIASLYLKKEKKNVKIYQMSTSGFDTCSHRQTVTDLTHTNTPTHTHLCTHTHQANNNC